MSEQERQRQRQVLAETLVREGVGLLVMGVVLLYLGPGRIWVQGAVEYARRRFRAQAEAADVEIAGFRRRMSEWEHEQAARPDS